MAIIPIDEDARYCYRCASVRKAVRDLWSAWRILGWCGDLVQEKARTPNSLTGRAPGNPLGINVFIFK